MREARALALLLNVDADRREAREKSRQIWDEMAPSWQKDADYLVEISRGVATWMVDKLDPQPGETVLELAAGPGDTGYLTAKHIGDTGQLITTDFAPNMVEIAQARAASLGVDNVSFRTMDAEQMDLPDDSVDGILCRWGFMLMLDPAQAFRECRRVLRPDGRLALSVWGTAEKNAFVTIVGMVLTQLGKPPQSNPFDVGGIFSLAEEKTLRGMLSDAGFNRIETSEIEVPWTFTDFDDYWRWVNEFAGAVAVLIRGLSEPEVAEVKDELRSALEPYREGDGYLLPGHTLNALAVTA